MIRSRLYLHSKRFDASAVNIEHILQEISVDETIRQSNVERLEELLKKLNLAKDLFRKRKK
jgi:hypothetical protein